MTRCTDDPRIINERWPALMKAKKAAEYLDVSLATVHRLRNEGHFRAVMVSGDSMPRYRRTDLDRFIESLREGKGRCAANAP